MITTEEYLYFAQRALDGMAAIVDSLGDDLANRRPPLAGANTAYALLTHCLGVAEAWAGGFVAGREVDRDRALEFEASGPVGPLLERVEAAKVQLGRDVASADFRAPLVSEPPREFHGPDTALTQGAALQHVYEELAQHHGQMELIRDVLLADLAPSARPEAVR